MRGLAELVICSPPSPREPARLETTRSEGYIVYPHQRIIHAWEVARLVWWNSGLKRVRVTSISEGKHKRGSRHYFGLATDFGYAGIPAPTRVKLHDAMLHRLGIDYDLVTHKTHLHIEWDPKLLSEESDRLISGVHLADS